MLKNLETKSDKDKNIVAQKYSNVINSGNCNTAYQFAFLEAILRSLEDNNFKTVVNLNQVMSQYANIIYIWCTKKKLFLGSKSEGINGYSALNGTVDQFIKKYDLVEEDILNKELLEELKGKIKSKSRWVIENIGSETKDFCRITKNEIIFDSKTTMFTEKYIKDIREENELAAKRFLSDIEANNKGLVDDMNLFECNENETVIHDSNMVINKVKIDFNDISKIHQYINSKGYRYGFLNLSNFYLSLKSKPFVILSGISGTGKSKLVRLFAEAISASFTLIPVRPDWSDATELLGYKDINQNFHPGKLTEVISEAIKNPTTPYIVCLDEMNLARVEYYFSDFLSLIESRHWEDGNIMTDVLPIKLTGTTDNLYIPDNLYIVGTVNMDETTFQFSKKVLDRANTIELNDVDLNYDFDEKLTQTSATPIHNSAMKSEYLILRDCKVYEELAKETISRLIEINNILTPCQMQFAYRVRDEVVFYMAYNEEYNMMTRDEAFDYQLIQKVLPRISGTSNRTHEMLVKLFWYCVDDKVVDENNYDLKEWNKRVDGARYPKSCMRLLDMIRRFDEDGFTSFWF